MYQLMQKEAFGGIEKLKKANPTPTDQSTHKKGYQDFYNHAGNVPHNYKQHISNAKQDTQNMWRGADEGFGTSRND